MASGPSLLNCTLSKLTGDPRYYDAAKRALVALFDRRSRLGLVGSAIDVRTGAWTDPDSHVSGGIDRDYNELVKNFTSPYLQLLPEYQGQLDEEIEFFLTEDEKDDLQEKLSVLIGMCVV